MITGLSARERGIPPRLPQDVIDELIERPRFIPVAPRQYTQHQALDMFNEHSTVSHSNDPAVALEGALEDAGENGFVATMPYLIAAAARGFSFGEFEEYNPLSEEVFGKDRAGLFGEKGSELLIALHGGVFLTPKNLRMRSTSNILGVECYRIQVEDIDFEKLLKGMHPDGESIEFYTLEEVTQGKVKNPFGRYGIVLDLNKNDIYESPITNAVSLTKAEFLKHPLVLARAGTPEYLEQFVDSREESQKNAHIEMDFASLSWREKYFPNCCGTQITPRYRFLANSFVLSKEVFFAINPDKEVPQ